MSEKREAWVVYDSVHGNTRAVAEAIAEGLRSGGPVQVVSASDANPARLAEARAVVLGCPTHAFQASPAMKELAARLTPGTLNDVPFAAFDTRFSVQGMPSRVLKVIVPIMGKRAWAATGLARTGLRAGARLLVEPEGFVVLDTEGPLAEGELDRAAAWGRALAATGA